MCVNVCYSTVLQFFLTFCGSILTSAKTNSSKADVFLSPKDLNLVSNPVNVFSPRDSLRILLEPNLRRDTSKAFSFKLFSKTRAVRGGLFQEFPLIRRYSKLFKSLKKCGFVGISEQHSDILRTRRFTIFWKALLDRVQRFRFSEKSRDFKSRWLAHTLSKSLEPSQFTKLLLKQLPTLNQAG